MRIFNTTLVRQTSNPAHDIACRAYRDLQRLTYTVPQARSLTNKRGNLYVCCGRRRSVMLKFMRFFHSRALENDDDFQTPYTQRSIIWGCFARVRRYPHRCKFRVAPKLKRCLDKYAGWLQMKIPKVYRYK